MARNSDKTMIRVMKKENPYVMIDKTCLKDERLSWKAKGLLCYLLSLPDDWEIYVSELQSHASDGRDSTAAGLRELIKFGYAKRYRNRDEKGKLRGCIYQIYEMPIEVESEEELEIEESTDSEIIENKEVYPETDFPSLDKNKPLTPETDFPYTGNPNTENPKLLNNNITNKEYTNNNVTNLSIVPDGDIEEKETIENGNEDRKSKLLEEIKKAKEIPLDFCKDKKKMEEVVELLTENEIYSDELKKESLELFKICLVEMTTQKEIQYYGKKKLSYKHLLEKINKNIEVHNSYVTFKMNLIDEIIDDYIDGALKTDVKNHKKYFKSCIVNGFDSHAVKFLSNVSKIAK